MQQQRKRGWWGNAAVGLRSIELSSAGGSAAYAGLGLASRVLQHNLGIDKRRKRYAQSCSRDSCHIRTLWSEPKSTSQNHPFF
jgi:hypothetical protein